MAAKGRRLRVTAPYVLARTAAAADILPGGHTWTTVGLYQGSLLPEDCPDADIERLLAKNMIEEVEG